MTFSTLLSFSLLLPVPQSPLQLPPPKPVANQDQRPAEELARFRRDLLELTGSVTQVETRLLEIGRAYPRLEPLLIEVARTARAAELVQATLVARRYGTLKVADEFRFQLLTRPLGDATRPMVETMATLYDQGAATSTRPALQELARSRIASARRPAVEVLATRATAEDLPFALQLAGDASLDLQLRGVELLRAVPADGARERLVQLLAKDPALAAAATEALVAIGQPAVPALQQLLAGPMIDRSHCYAGFALAQIGPIAGALLAPEHGRVLARALSGPEVLARSLAAVPLADLAHRGQLAADLASDTAIVEALLGVVDGKAFVPNLDLLRRPCEERLLRLTGRVAMGDGLGWQAWWAEQKQGFVGIRAAVAVTAETAPRTVVMLRQERQVVRLLGEELADLQPLPGAQEILLTGPQLAALVAALHDGGFADPTAMHTPAGLPLVRSLQLQVPGARMQVAMPALEHPAFDGLVARVEAVIDAELWQLYRDPQAEPDRAAFWRAERRWLDANPDPVARGQRFVQRLFAGWNGLPPALKVRALAHLFGRPDRRQLLREADGAAILAIVDATPELGNLEHRLLELAAGAPGDVVWRDCVDLAARKPGGGRTAVAAVFAVLGPDAVLAALQDLRSLVRRVAIDEVIRVRDLRAAARLVELIGDADALVAEGAAHACGQLQIADASSALVGRIAAEGTPVEVRREALRALGRVGGPQAYAVLERAVAAPVEADKEAALRGLGELRDPRAAHLLAELAVVGHGKDLGQLARYHLQRMGAHLAVPALQHQVKLVRDDSIRAQLVLLLGGYQVPEVMPDLLDLLRLPATTADAAMAIATTTGLDVMVLDDRVGTCEQWWRLHKNEPQWQWLLAALAAAKVPTVLRAEHFGPGADLEALPELVRLLAEGKEPRLCALVAAVLRTVSGEDHGVVSLQTPGEVRAAIAARYRLLYEVKQAAQGR